MPGLVVGFSAMRVRSLLPFSTGASFTRMLELAVAVLKAVALPLVEC